MLDLKGDVIDVDFFYNLQHLKDLIWYNGPLLYVVTDVTTGLTYLVAWADTDNNIERWAVYSVTDEDICSYLDNHIGLRTLVCKNKEILMFDICDDAVISGIKIELSTYLDYAGPTNDLRLSDS